MDVATTQIYTLVLNRGGHAALSPPDRKLIGAVAPVEWPLTAVTRRGASRSLVYCWYLATTMPAYCWHEKTATWAVLSCCLHRLVGETGFEPATSTSRT